MSSFVFNQLLEDALTPEQAKQCVKAIRTGKPAARAKAINFMIEHSLREAVLFLREVSKSKLSDGELVSVAYKALERSARSYRPEKGKRFFYFSKKALRGVLIEYWRSLETVKHGNSAMSWDEAITLERGKKMHPDIEDLETTSELEGRTEADFPAIHRAEDFQRVMAAMKCLTKFERALVLFVRATGFSFRETAEEFGCSRAWVGLCWNRALDKLRAVVLKK
jgi:RNA polymerase sigma factor (sigma-70 family)